MILLIAGVVSVVLVVLIGTRKSAPPAVTQTLSPPPQTMRVTRMLTHVFARVSRASGQIEEALPHSPLGHGEYATALTSTPTGTVFVVGKHYTGKPGPDVGFVAIRTTDGQWQLPFTLEGRTFHSVYARSNTDVYVGAMGGYVHFDGASWQLVECGPHEVMTVFVEADQCMLSSSRGTETFQLTGRTVEPAAPRKAPLRANTCQAGDAQFSVFERSTKLGEEHLSPEEDAQVRREIDQLSAALAGKERQPR